jgi:transcriptional regulator with XRE-family HTH domain
MNLDPRHVLDWEEGRGEPGLRQLDSLGRLYGREIDYFLRETPAPPDKIEFRGKAGQSLANLPRETKIALAQFDELCRTAFEFEVLLNRRQPVKLPRFKGSHSPERVGRNLREQFALNRKAEEDNRTPDELIAIIQAQAADIASAVEALKNKGI